MERRREKGRRERGREGDLAVSTDLDGLAVIPGILEVLAHVEVQRSLVDPLQFEDAAQLGLGDAGREDPGNLRPIVARLGLQPSKPLKPATLADGEDEDNVAAISICLVQFLLVVGRSRPHTPLFGNVDVLKVVALYDKVACVGKELVGYLVGP
jgi:hypothetical protein